MLERVSETEEEMLGRAFRLAYFLHPDRTIAREVAIAAMDGVEVMAAAQKRRRYYRPIGRRARRFGRRDRVVLERPHLLQRLVYCESEPFEREHEAAKGGKRPTEEDMVVRFIAFLVRITSGRNSLYVAVGLGRLLYRLDTEATVRLHDLVVQDPKRFCASDYVRSRKNLLLREVVQRFGGALRVRSGSHGEKGIEPLEDSRKLTELAQSALLMFTPWGTDCVVPSELDPIRQPIPELAFAGSDPDDEHPIEIDRIHALIHPECFARLVRALGYEDFSKRLALPRFHMKLDSADPGDSDGHRERALPYPSTGERQRAREELRRRHDRRRRYCPGALTLWINGRETGPLPFDQAAQTRLETVYDIERLEVRGRDAEGELRLAAWMPSLLVSPGETAQHRAVARLPRGNEIRFTLTRHDADPGWTIEVALREASSLRRLARIASSRIAGAKIAGAREIDWQRSRPALAATVLIALASIGLLLRFASEPLRQRPLQQEPPVEAIASDKEIASDQASASQDLRRGTPAELGIPLTEVESVLVRALADDRLCQSLARTMKDDLGRQGRFHATTSLEDADAVLEIARAPHADMPAGSGNGPWVKLTLVNRRGEVLWRDHERGEARAISRRSLSRLVAAAERAP